MPFNHKNTRHPLADAIRSIPTVLALKGVIGGAAAALAGSGVVLPMVGVNPTMSVETTVSIIGASLGLLAAIKRP